jgi:hypothetical protein
MRFGTPLSNEPAAVDVTLAFLSENVIAMRRCTPFVGRPQRRTCWLDVAQLSGGDLRITAETETAERPDSTHDVFAMANGAILLTANTVQYLYSPDLKTRREIPIDSPFVPRVPGKIVGESKGDPNDQSWTLYRLSPDLVPIRSSRGTLYDVSDDYVMFFLDGTIRVETLNGLLVGRIGPSSSYTPELVAPDRLYLSGPKPAIADFNGHELRKLRAPGGYGTRNRWSADGRRVLLEHFIQTPATLGEVIQQRLPLPIPKGANGETIWVVDTSNDGMCLQWDSPAQLLGVPFQSHADLSPSGRLLAAATGTGLSVYPLPETCTSR